MKGSRESLRSGFHKSTDQQMNNFPEADQEKYSIRIGGRGNKGTTEGSRERGPGGNNQAVATRVVEAYDDEDEHSDDGLVGN